MRVLVTFQIFREEGTRVSELVWMTEEWGNRILDLSRATAPDLDCTPSNRTDNNGDAAFIVFSVNLIRLAKPCLQSIQITSIIDSPASPAASNNFFR